MIRFILKHIIKPFSILLSVYMMNLSIDASDMEGGQFDPTINEIESVFELIIEVVMGMGDVLPEHDEPDPETETCFFGLDHIIPSGVFQLEVKLEYYIHETVSFILLSYKNPSITIQSPPPKFG